MTPGEIADLCRRRAEAAKEAMAAVQKEATLVALDTAVKNTPPLPDVTYGTGTITGNAQASWSADPEPSDDGSKRVTILKNDAYYISYLNDGHRMDKHFVPGLMVNPYSGLLERVPKEMGGITVGTKTKWVDGKFMNEKAIDAYKEYIGENLLPRVRKAVEEVK